MGEVTAELFRDGKVVERLTLEASRPCVGESEFLWIELLDPTEEDLALLARRFGLHGLAVGDALRPSQAPKVDLYDELLFVVLQRARLEGDEVRYTAIDAFVSQRHIITVRHGEDAAYAEARSRFHSGPRSTLLGPDFILHALMDFIVDSYHPVLQMLEDEVLAMERMFLDEFLGRAEVTRLFALRGQALQLQHVLNRMSDVCGKLINLQVPSIGPEVKPYFQFVQDHLVRLDGVIRGLIDVIRAVFEASNLLEQQRQSAITRQLAAWAAILGVPTVLAGVYGMHAPHIPAPYAQTGFLIAVAAMLLVCFVLFLRFRKLRWL